MGKAWKIEGFQDPDLAIAAVRHTQPNLIISDFKMPQMIGTVLLDRVRQIAPSTIRVLVSGYLDPKALDSTLSSAHQYFAKPFLLPDIRCKLQKALNAAERFQNPEIRATVLALRTLPALPQIYYQLLAALEDPDVSYSAVVDMLGKDTAICAKILQMANWPLFGNQTHSQSVADLLQAVTLLGTERIKAVVMSHQLLKNQTSIPSAFLPEKLMQHRWDTAHLAYALSRQMNLHEEQARDAYVAGLLHDLGRRVLIDNFTNKYNILCKKALDENKPVTAVEQEIFKMAHSDVMGFLVSLWGMRDRVSSAIIYQEKPWDAPTPEEVQIAAAVYLAHINVNKAHRSEAFVLPEVNRDFLASHNLLPLLQ